MGAAKLEGRLRKFCLEDCKDPVPTHLLRSYVRYARKYVHPRLSPGAAWVLQDYYLKMRANRKSQDSTPITTRQLEALIRLAQARAKTELRELVLKTDAEDVVAILNSAILEICTDEHGAVDFGRGADGGGMSKQGSYKALLARLVARSSEKRDAMFTTQEIRDIADEHRILAGTGRSVQEVIEQLNNTNELINKGGGKWRLEKSEFRNCRADYRE